MKTLRQFNKDHHDKFPLIIVLAVLFLVVASSITYAYYSRPNNAPINNPSEAANTTSSTSQNDSTAQPSANQTSGNTADNPKANVSNGTTSNSGTAVVTVTSVDQSVARKISVSAYTNAIVSTGTCTFTFTKDSAVVTRTTDVLQNASSSSCDTLTIDTSSFPSLGTWQLVVSFQSGTISGQSDSQAVVVK